MSEDFIRQAKLRAAADKARNMRYKRSMLAGLGYSEIMSGLEEMSEACADVRYFAETDEDTLLDALDGDEDELWEFKMAFTDVYAAADRLLEEMYDIETYDDYLEDHFNNCTVALIGNRFEIVGFDSFVEDYMSMTRYQQDLAQTEAGKRLMRMTKAEMISAVGQCFGILLAYYDLRIQYDNLSGAIDMMRGENRALLETVKRIEALYDKQEDAGWQGCPEWEQLLSYLPDRAWLE